MSTDKSAPQKAPARIVRKNFEIAQLSADEPSAIDAIEVTSLQIEDACDSDCDPYNCTGQFLAETLKKKFGD
ncbi:MAG: hypothetical protein OEM60_05045 [Gammaproteobacteria bacterium]|nr:hypothetical protein [Gammaproteobacteria bacterium]MDH3433199.1 hypothetical protein [Gammaproteobacteria bacterium]